MKVEMKEAKELVSLIRKRFPVSTGSMFKFKNDVTIITLEDLEFALDRLMKEGKLVFNKVDKTI